MISLKAIDYFDSPVVLDCSVTNIPGSGSSPLQVIAALYRTSYRIYVHDSIGLHIGLYTGASGQEVFHCLIGLGADWFPVSLHRGARISLRSMTTSAITGGLLSIGFYGSTVD